MGVCCEVKLCFRKWHDCAFSLYIYLLEGKQIVAGKIESNKLSLLDSVVSFLYFVRLQPKGNPDGGREKNKQEMWGEGRLVLGP